MSEQVMLKAAVREETGKGSCRALRTKKMVPGVFYAKDENVMLQVPQLELEKVYAQVRTSQLLTIEIEGKEARPALIKELVWHPFKKQITHFDVCGVDMDKPVRVRVPLRIVGTAPAMAMGAKLEVYRTSCTVECLPANLPEAIDVVISNLQTNQTLQIEEIAMPEGVKALSDDNFAVLHLALKGADEEGEEEAEA